MADKMMDGGIAFVLDKIFEAIYLYNLGRGRCGHLLPFYILIKFQ